MMSRLKVGKETGHVHGSHYALSSECEDVVHEFQRGEHQKDIQ